MANHNYKGIPGEHVRDLISRESFLCQNPFAEKTLEELKELFQQYRFLCTNTYCPLNSKLDEIKKTHYDGIPNEVISLSIDLLNAIAAKVFMENEEE